VGVGVGVGPVVVMVRPCSATRRPTAPDETLRRRTAPSTDWWIPVLLVRRGTMFP
jgi:hypothetical protein